MKRVIEFEAIRYSDGTEERRQQRIELLKSMSNYELNLIIAETKLVVAKIYYSSFKKADDLNPPSDLSNGGIDISKHLERMKKRKYGFAIWDNAKQEEIAPSEALI